MDAVVGDEVTGQRRLGLHLIRPGGACSARAAVAATVFPTVLTNWADAHRAELV